MELAKIDSIELSRYILAKWGSMPHLKLQKLVFYVEAFHLAYFEQPLIEDQFEAWMHGPVSPKVWRQFKDYDSPLLNTVAVKPQEAEEAISAVESKITAEQKDLIADVMGEFGDKSAYHLECLTHSESPWIEARGATAPEERCSAPISKDSMKSYYRTLIYTTCDEDKAKAART